MNRQEDWNKDTIVTVYGHLKDGILTSEGEDLLCISYRSFKKEYTDTWGFFNLKYIAELDVWAIFQVVEFVEN